MNAPNPQPQNTESETTGLPALRAWRSVYLVVTAIFILWVALLVALERFFS
jgi:hypothetical protein